jgi:membrane fusion protein, copper/silver efflux system
MSVNESPPLSRAKKIKLIVLVILKRVRFLAVLAAVGLFVGYWDTVKNYWDKWTQPRSVSLRRLEPGQEFFCPMHPQVVRETYEPNGDVPKCPICGMSLSIRSKSEALRLPEGVIGRVQLSPDRVRQAGITTVPVERRQLGRRIQAVGLVAYDQTRLSQIVSRVGGYVEKLYVDEIFTKVHKGDPLAEIYSPELYSSARELALAAAGKGADNIASAERKKLLLLGVAEQDVDAIAASGQSSPRIVIRSPQEGFVVDKKIVAGSSFEAKATLFEVADLSTVWIEADVFEKDLPALRVGQDVEILVEALPNRAFSGKLASIYPQVDGATRTNRVRIVLDNPQGELHPGMFAAVRIDAARQESLAVPERAVVDTGAKKIVYVEREPGVFEGVEVELGPRDGPYYPVFKGLESGQSVAASGSFLIDAETRLNPAAASSYYGAFNDRKNN